MGAAEALSEAMVHRRITQQQAADELDSLMTSWLAAPAERAANKQRKSPSR